MPEKNQRETTGKVLDVPLAREDALTEEVQAEEARAGTEGLREDRFQIKALVAKVEQEVPESAVKGETVGFRIEVAVLGVRMENVADGFRMIGRMKARSSRLGFIPMTPVFRRLSKRSGQTISPTSFFM